MSTILTTTMRIWALIIGLLLFQLASAQPSTYLKHFASQAAVIPAELLRQNKTKIGELDIVQLSEEMKQVQWFENQGSFLAGSGESRFGAMYFVKEKKIIINSARAQYEPSHTMPVAALHEALGALGYLDENYEVSTTLYLNSLSSTEQKNIFSVPFIEKQNKKLKTLERRKSDAVYKNSGGGTSVGGGGDGISVQVKIYSLMFAQPICTQFNLSCVDILEKLMAAQIEINTDVHSSSPILDQRNDSRVFRIPMIHWLNGSMATRGTALSTDQIRILKELVELVNQDAP